MKPAPFDYLRAASPAEALEALHQAGADARVLAGGQSLLPMLNMRLTRPRVLIDVMGVPAWQRVEDAGRLAAHRRGGAAGHASSACPAWPSASRCWPPRWRWVGHAQTRSRGTVCGSVAHADPSAELPLVLLALRGTVHLRSRRRHRDVRADAFFTGMMTTACAEDELIEAVSLPAARPGAGCAFREVARRHGDFAIVACAAVADASGVRLAVGGVADRPRALDLPADPAVFADALDRFAWDLEARDDLHATARYRRELVRQIGREVLETAIKAAASPPPLEGGGRREGSKQPSSRPLPPTPSLKGRGSLPGTPCASP